MRCSSIFEAISLNSDHEPIARTLLPLMTAAVVDQAEDRPRAASLLEFNAYNDNDNVPYDHVDADDSTNGGPTVSVERHATTNNCDDERPRLQR